MITATQHMTVSMRPMFIRGVIIMNNQSLFLLLEFNAVNLVGVSNGC